MIPGDIDLTKNLDFRRKVKKEIPQLPSEWNGNNKKKSSITINSSSTYYTYSTNITTYHRDDMLDHIDTWINDSIISTVSSYDNITTNNTNYTFTISDRNGTKYKYYGIDDWYTIPTPKKDVFGNIIKEPEPIPKIPWGEAYSNNPSRSIAWRTSTYRDRLYDNRIPWDVEYIDTIEGRFHFEEEEDIFDKAKKMICWLNDKSISFIKRYLDYDDGKDLSYLTNMSWIRVKDAIID